MPATDLTPLSVFDDALARARHAVIQVLSVVSVTLHHQFPTGAYLVLTRPVGDYDDDSLELDSIRDAQGGTLWKFSWCIRGYEELPEVPMEVATLWGKHDPRKAADIIGLLREADDLAPYEYFDFLPGELRTAEEIAAEDDGGRTPLGLPLAAEHCPQHGPMCQPDNHIEPPTVHEKAPQMGPAAVVTPCTCGRVNGVCAPCCGSSACPTVCSSCTTWRATC